MCSILLTVVLLCVGGSLAVDVARCSTANDTESKLTLEPYNDGIAGRYLAKLCTDPVPEVTSWTLSLMLYKSEYPCKHAPFKGIHIPGKTHSTYQESLVIEGNCSQICLNTTFDLVFSGCYAIESAFFVGNHRRNPNYTYFIINNNFTIEDFMHNTPLFDVQNHDKENMTVVWHTGVPFEDFELMACPIVNNTEGGEVEAQQACRTWTGAECAPPSPVEVRCRVRLPDGSYMLSLHLQASWRHGFLRDQAFVPQRYEKWVPPEPTVSGSSLVWVWAVCGALALSVACVAVHCACVSRAARAHHKAVLREWLVHRNESSPVPTPVNPRRKHIVLVYAREGPHAARVTDSLRALLQLAPDTQVYDIFTPEVTSLCAPSPGAWLRGMLARDDVTVLLLQSPALALLYRDQLRGGDLIELGSPLMGSRVMYREPQFGDSVVQFALRMTSLAPCNYHKYYVATLTDLPTEIFPQLVPYRRYHLPDATSLLLRDVCDVTVPDDVIYNFTAAVQQFVDHARDNPNYLMDELMFIPT